MNVFSNKTLWLSVSAIFLMSSTVFAAGANMRNRVLDLSTVPAPPLDHRTQPSPPGQTTQANIVLPAEHPTVTTTSTSDAIPPESREPVRVSAPISVSVAPISAPQASGFGILTDANGGLRFDIWKGTTRATLDTLVPLLAGGIAHDPSRSLATRLMLTSADVPNGTSKKDLLALRLGALFRMGQEDKALEMIKALPVSVLSAPILGMKADIQLLSGDVEGACQTSQEAVQRYDEVYWQKLLIYCKARAGKKDEAQLGLDVLQEQARSPEPYFSELINRMGGAKVKKPTKLPDTLSWSDAGMLLALGVSLPQSYLSQAPLPVLRAVAKSSGSSVDARAVALEQLVNYGVADPKELEAAYAAFSFSAKEMADTQLPQGAKGSALLFQRQAQQKNAAQRIALWKTAFDQYDAAGLLPLAWRVYAPIIEASGAPAASKQASDFARDAYSALLMLGKADAAEPWLALLSQADPFGYAVGQMTMQFSERNSSNVSHIDGPTVPQNAQSADIKRLFRLYRVMEVMGYNLNEQNRNQMLSLRPTYQVTLPAPALVSGLDDAASNHRLGETVLTSVLVLGGGTLSDAGDEVLVKAIKALSEAGFETEARRIAVESVLALRR